MVNLQIYRRYKSSRTQYENNVFSQSIATQNWSQRVKGNGVFMLCFSIKTFFSGRVESLYKDGLGALTSKRSIEFFIQTTIFQLS